MHFTKSYYMFNLFLNINYYFVIRIFSSKFSLSKEISKSSVIELDILFSLTMLFNVNTFF